jgi:hypothetical protein
MRTEVKTLVLVLVLVLVLEVELKLSIGQRVKVSCFSVKCSYRSKLKLRKIRC